MSGDNPGDMLKMGAETQRPISRTLNAMPVVVLFRPKLSRFHSDYVDGETLFVESPWGTSPNQIGWSAYGAGNFRNASVLRTEFLKVRSERGALDFLRDTGPFVRGVQPLSWTTFKRWQVFTESMMAVEEANPTGVSESSRILRFLGSDGWSDNYFSVPEPLVRDGDFMRTLMSLRAGATDFISPSSHSYSIEFVPNSAASQAWTEREVESAIEAHKRHKADSLMETIQSDPMLVFRPQSTISAIAAAVWSDRHAGAKWGRCPECGELFMKRAHIDKKFCDGPCKARVKKRENRARKSTG